MSVASASSRPLPSFSPAKRQVCSSLRFNADNSPNYFLYKGYRLAYAEFGSTVGTPVFYFHDSGSSRLEASLFHQAAQRNGFRLIAIDRPGIGKSDFYRCNQPEDFCDAVRALARSLKLQHFGVMSLGAGGLYALSLARFCAEQTTFMLNLAGVPGSVFNESGGKRNYPASCWNELTPMLVKILVRLRYRFFRSDPSASLNNLEHHLCRADRHALQDPSVRRVLARDHEEALHGGYRGVAQDIALCYRKLEFRLRDVAVPTMIWQGETDRLSQRSDCEYMAARMPDARFYRVPDRGHFFFVNKMDRVFDELRQVLSSRSDRSAA